MQIHSLCAFLVTAILLTAPAAAFGAPLKLKGKVVAGSGYSVLLVGQDGATRSVTLGASGAFRFTGLSRSVLRNATLHLVAPDGRYWGPVVLGGNGTKAYLALSGRVGGESSTISLGKLSIEDEGYSKPRRTLPRALYNVRSSTTANAGIPIGTGNGGFVEAVAGEASLRARRVGAAESGDDTDRDGVLDVFDADDDGDLVADYADPESAATTAADSPYSALYLSLPAAINLNAAEIFISDVDEVIRGENTFSVTLYQSLGGEQYSSVTGGHVICNDAMLYCRSSSAGGGTAIYSGVSESDQSLVGGLWTDLNTNGSGYPNFEYLESRQAVVASFQPRVGLEDIRPGHVFSVELTDGDGTVVERKSMSLPPYFVTVPAAKSYDAGSGVQTIEYPADNSTPGASPGNPIVLTSEGELTLSLWRPQRTAISESEEEDFMDMGHLHYGVLIGNLSQEGTCAGYYSNLSSDLSENPDALGNGGSPFSHEGARLWPLDDAADDAAPDDENTIEFTVNLKDCLARIGEAPGTYPISLTAAGEDFRNGANRAAVTIYVTIP